MIVTARTTTQVDEVVRRARPGRLRARRGRDDARRGRARACRARPRSSRRRRTVATTSRATRPGASTRCSPRRAAIDGPATHPLILGVLDRVLGHYQLSAPTGIEIGPGRGRAAAAPRRRDLPDAAAARRARRQRDVAARGLHRGERRDPRRAREPSLDRRAPDARRRRRVASRCRPAPRSSTSAASGTAAARTAPTTPAAGRGAALRRRVAAAGREPRARGAARRRARRCPHASAGAARLQHPAAVHRLRRRPPPGALPRRLPRRRGHRPCGLDRDAMRVELWHASGGPGAEGQREMMQRFWSVLAVNLGKRAGLVSVIGLLVTLVLGLGITQARLRDRPGQLPEQGRPGLQGQRRLPGPLRRPGDAHRHHDGRGPHRRRAVRPPRTASSSQRSTTSCRDRHAARCHHAAHRSLEFADSLVQSADGDPTAEHRGRRALQTALAKERPRSPERQARVEDAGATARAPQRHPGGQRTLDNPEWVELPRSTTTRARSGSRSARSSSTDARADRRPARRATSRSRPRARPPDLVRDAG